jgi:hypothetical protein
MKDVFHQLIDILGAAIREFALGQRPNSFIGVEFRGIGGKVFDGETRVLTKEFLEWFPLMGAGVIQQNNDRPAHVPQQLTQKHTDLFLCDVVKEE